MNKTFIWGHRGSGFIGTQNTLSSFKNAIDMGVDGLKTEAQLSKEGEVFLTFYNSIKFNGEEVLIKDLSSEEIKKYHLDNGETIPTLHELFDTFKGYQLKYNFDIKLPEVGIKIIEVARKYALIDHIEIAKPSILPDSLPSIFSKIREFDKKVCLINSVFLKYSNITEEHLELEEMKRLNIEGINVNYNYANFELFKKVKDLGFKFYIWGVLFKRPMQKFLSMKYNDEYIDGIFTNQPDRILKFRKEIQN
ncbi:MAG: glycerophosphodiester phosphodiesterase [Candidatus Heimdallarchaeota archaeon]